MTSKVWRTDIYVTHTTKPDTCFVVRQVGVLVCDETKQTISIVDLTDFLVCKYVGTLSLPRNFSICLIQKYMNKRRHVTDELPCTHDKYIQIDRQMCVVLLVGVQVRWQFFSLWHTLRTCVCVKHEYLCSRVSIDVVRCCFWEHLKKKCLQVGIILNYSNITLKLY